MTTFAKRRSFLGRILGHWLYSLVKEVEEIEQEAKHWDAMMPCKKCKQEISTYSQYCSSCGTWQEEVEEKSSFFATEPMRFIEIGGERYYFEKDQSGKLLIEGKRPTQAYREHVRQMQEDAQWLNR